MKTSIASSLFLAIVESARALESGTSSAGSPSSKYTLKDVHVVKGRQGITTNGTHYFNTGSKGLYVYDTEWNMVMENEDPFAGLGESLNHFGDIGYYNGSIYTGAENFVNGRGQDIAIMLYDPETLKMTEEIPWHPESGQVEVSAITVDTDNGLVWMTDWVNSTHIYSYDLKTGEYVSKIHLRPTPEWTQGIAFFKGDIYITADDGTADRRESDNLWKINRDDFPKNATFIHHEMEFTSKDIFKDWGEIEGIEFDTERNEMLVLSNRGKIINLGMPMGLYPGYDAEISEVYVFSIDEIENPETKPEVENPETEPEVENPETIPEETEPEDTNAGDDKEEVSASIYPSNGHIRIGLALSLAALLSLW